MHANAASIERGGQFRTVRQDRHGVPLSYVGEKLASAIFN